MTEIRALSPPAYSAMALLAIVLVLAMAPLAMNDAFAIEGGRLLDGFEDLQRVVGPEGNSTSKKPISAPLLSFRALVIVITGASDFRKMRREAGQ